jgi:hypothetical protein
MEPEGPVPCLQQPAAGICPKPDESSPRNTHPISLRSIIISSHLRLDLPNDEEYKLWSSSLCSFLQSPYTSSSLCPNILFNILSRTPSVDLD